MMYIPQRRREDSFWGRVGNFLKRFLIVMGAAATVSVVFLVLTLNKVANYVPPSLPDKMILTYTFKSGLLETVGKPSLSQPLLRPATTFHEIIDSLTQAVRDKRVKGFVARLQEINMSPAQIQELRAAVEKFRAAKKFAYVFADEFGGFSSGMGDYYLASSFEQVWLQPVGAVSINGISAEVPFLKGVMDKAGVDAEFGHKGKYKSASESLTETGMSAPHREMMTVLVNDLADQMVSGVAADRKMPPAEVMQIINGAPYSGEEAAKLKLVDKIGYYDQMLEEARTRAGKGAELVGLLGYSFKDDTINLNQGMVGFTTQFFHKTDPEHVHRNKAKIALIFGTGDIIPYTSQSRVGLSGSNMAADKIVAAFEAAQKDKDILAVVLRIDTPGGSPEAAETIRRAIIETQQKGKPVIVSMGGYAASGGYWLAAAADKIVAQPSTITGSIGVFGGKFVLSRLWEKLGVNWDSVSVGDNARMWSSNALFSEKEKERFDFLLGNIYDAFILRVMEGRHLTREQVLAVADGRVWTGRQAKERGLVDELGGLDRAVTLAKLAVKLDPAQEVPLERLPKRKSTLEMFIQLATEGVSVNPVININASDIIHEIEAGSGFLRAPEIRLR